MQNRMLLCLALLLGVLMYCPNAFAKTIYHALEENATGKEIDQKKLQPPPDRVVVMDLTKKKEQGDNIPVIVVPANLEIGNLPSVKDAQGNVVSKADFLKSLSQNDAVKKTSDTRWISEKGNVIKLYTYHTSYTIVTAAFVENERNTRLESDLGTLLNALALNIKAAEEIVVYTQSYTLTQPRANLAITATATTSEAQAQRASKMLGEEAVGTVTRNRQPGWTAADLNREQLAASAEASDPAKSTAGEYAKANVTIVTGPAEHWFLSTDLAVNTVSQLKYDSDSKSIVNKDKPTKFMIGINYTMGDILTDKWTRDWEWAGGFTAKLMFEASDRPLNTLALGVGYRMPPINWYGFSLDTFSPFVAYSRFKEDKLNADGSVNTNGKTAWKWIYGVSFNLDKASDWLKKTVSTPSASTTAK